MSQVIELFKQNHYNKPRWTTLSVLYPYVRMYVCTHCMKCKHCVRTWKYVCTLLSTWSVHTYVCTYVRMRSTVYWKCTYVRMCSIVYLKSMHVHIVYLKSMYHLGGVLVAGRANKRASNDFTQVPIAELEMFSLYPLPTSGDKSCKAIKLQF